MTQSAKDQLEGTLHEIAGAVKEKVGQAIGSPGLTAEGQDENLAGKIQKKTGEIEKVFES